MTNNRFDLVCIDIDGTLLDSQHRFSTGAVEVIAALQEAGIRPVLASGRTRIEMQPWQEALGLGLLHIGAGGAYLCDERGELIYHQPVPDACLLPVTHLARQSGLAISFFTPDRILIEGDEANVALLAEYSGSAQIVEDILACRNTGISKIIICGPRDHLEVVASAIRSSNPPLTLVYSVSYFLEVNARGVTKGYGLRRLADYLGVPLGRVVAIGDSYNDISMFDAAGLSIAMGNAPNAVQEQADFIAPTNDQGGLAWALEQLVLS